MQIMCFSRYILRKCHNNTAKVNTKEGFVFGDDKFIVLTPAIQSVMLGGGSLGLARPNSLFIFAD